METEQDLGELLDAIVWGHRVVEVDDKNVYVFRPLTLEERNMANYIHQRTLKRSKAKTRAELKKTMARQGLWKASNDKDVKLLREELGKLGEKLQAEEEKNKKRRTPTSKLVRLRKRSAALTKTILEIERDYSLYIELPSAEYEAECERGTYCLHCSVMSFPDMKPVWASLKDLKNEEDTELVSKLMGLYYSLQIATEAEIRQVARSGLWRVRWLGSRKNRGVKTLFDREMYDLTADQMHLVYWSQIYDSAFESMEPPPDEIVEDDQQFDRWLEAQHQKRKQERAQSSLNKKTSKTKDAHEIALSTEGFYSEECTCGIKEEVQQHRHKRGHLHAPSCPHGVFIYYDSETREKKVEEIQSANPNSIRQLLGREQKRLSETEGMVEDQHLRSNDKIRAVLGMETRYHGPGDAGKKHIKGRARPS